jgi:predicted TIM-barrel fold metal-dependent hydrolase
MSLTAAIEELRLVDQHLHSVLPGALARPEVEGFLTESDRPPPPGTTQFDSQLGFALRRWCGPVLDLDPAVTPDAYVARRNALTRSTRPGTGLTGRLLSAAGCAGLLVDTGFAAPGSVSLAELTELSGAEVREVVRLETVAEELAASGCTADGFAAAYGDLLAERTSRAVAVKSIIAYRHGLDFDPARPSRREVAAAAGDWLRSEQARLTDPVLLREVLWAGVDRGLPVQLHTGFGDPDLNLRRADPLLAMDFLASLSGAGVQVVLLHCYPFHRGGAFLAQAYPHVYLDLGLTINYAGARAAAVLAEALELAPFGKVLYSSDAFGLPELVYLGARLWRNAMAEVLGGWIAAGHWVEADAIRVARLIGAANAVRLYGLTPIT